MQMSSHFVDSYNRVDIRKYKEMIYYIILFLLLDIVLLSLALWGLREIMIYLYPVHPMTYTVINEPL
jgi:hypothetical protein